jgi:hypothetical protein
LRRGEGLKASTLSYWRWRLGLTQGNGSGTRTGENAGRRLEQVEETRTIDRRANFVGFELVAPAATGAEVEVVVEGGLCVRVASHFDEVTLRRVLSVLREATR